MKRSLTPREALNKMPLLFYLLILITVGLNLDKCDIINFFFALKSDQTKRPTALSQGIGLISPVLMPRIFIFYHSI